MYIRVNNVNIYYECIGNGKEVLFIPGNGTSFKYMLKLAKLLSKKYKVYLIDRRGQGRSTKICEQSYDLNIEDIYEIINRLNITNPYIVGHSGGATITMMFLAKYHNIVPKAVLCSGATNMESVRKKQLKLWEIYSKIGIMSKKTLNMVLGQKDITEDIKGIKAKTLILAGKKDIIKQQHTQTIVNNIPNVKFKIYEEENHSSYIVNTKCYKDIMDFFSE